MAKGGFVDIATRETAATAIRRAKKAAKAAGAGKAKKTEELRFSLAREDRYERPVATLESVNDVLPMASARDEPLFSLFAAKPIQVSKSLVVEYLDTAPLYLVEGVDLTWIKHNWPSLMNIVKLMEPGDMHHEKREIQNVERIWNTTLYVKRIA